MPTSLTFDQLDELHRRDGPATAIDRLIQSLREEKDYRRLFDALLLKKRFQMGLPLAQPAALDVPDDQRDEFEQAFIEAAREVGELYLRDDDIPHAWAFLNMIREPQRVAEAIEQIQPRREYDEKQEKIIEVALYQGANPVKGLELLLHSHGTCNTITAFNQSAPQMKPEERRRAAAMMVRQLYEDLCGTLNHEVQARIAGQPASNSLRELMQGRDWLFAEGNYHIDTSHLNSVVGFARFLEKDDPELEQAIELAEYGARLDPRFQFAGEAPFEEFYPAHIHYFHVLSGKDVEAGLEYFRAKLAAEPDERDKPMLAYVLVDLLVRVGRTGEAVDIAAAHLKDLDESSGFSLAQLCQEAKRMDTLRAVSREKGDLVRYAAALIQDGVQ